MTRIGRLWVPKLGLFVLCCSAVAADLPGTELRVQFNIDAPTMVAALIQFTQQSRLQLVLPTEGTDGIAAPRVQGSFTPRDALQRLLRNSGLAFEFVNAHTVLVRVEVMAPQAAERAGAPASGASQIRVVGDK